MSFIVALQFLTTVPPILRRQMDVASFGRSVGYFPLVGLLIGAVLAGLDLLLGHVLPPGVVNLLLVVVLVLLTGGLHLDGLADTSDAVFSRKSPQERMVIMKDSRVGTFGVIAVCLIIMSKWVALGSMPSTARWGALLLAPVLGRWVMTLVLVIFPYGRPGSGLASSFKQGAGSWQMVLATVVTVGSCGLAFGVQGVLMMLIVAAAALAAVAYLLRKLPALTGDSYGAICEVVEAIVLLLATTGLWGTAWLQ